MKTPEEILKEHLDKNGIEIAKVYTKYLYDAMEAYHNQFESYSREEVEKYLASFINQVIEWVENNRDKRTKNRQKWRDEAWR